jgi:hypothetical protein
MRVAESLFSESSSSKTRPRAARHLNPRQNLVFETLIRANFERGRVREQAAVFVSGMLTLAED